MKVLKKDVMNHYKYVIKCGYCEAQELLSHINRIAYTTGVYGWNADVYELDEDTAIVTGYRPFGNIVANREILEKYNNETKELFKDSGLTDQEKEICYYDLLDEFKANLV